MCSNNLTLIYKNICNILIITINKIMEKTSNHIIFKQTNIKLQLSNCSLKAFNPIDDIVWFHLLQVLILYIILII